MALSPGNRLGPYEIISPLGAVNVLPQHLTSNPGIRARFEHEAKTVSSHNHPHICTLHDVGRSGELRSSDATFTDQLQGTFGLLVPELGLELRRLFSLEIFWQRGKGDGSRFS